LIVAFQPRRAANQRAEDDFGETASRVGNTCDFQRFTAVVDKQDKVGEFTGVNGWLPTERSEHKPYHIAYFAAASRELLAQRVAEFCLTAPVQDQLQVEPITINVGVNRVSACTQRGDNRFGTRACLIANQCNPLFKPSADVRVGDRESQLVLRIKV
jgi:hypothetical protein